MGQVAPTTPREARTITTPHGSVENTFDIARMVQASGASFVARWTTYQPRQLMKSIKKAIQKKGFAFIEVISQCPVQFGAKTGAGSAVEMLEMYRKSSISVKKAVEMSPQEIEDKIVTGEFIDTAKPELCDEIARLKERIRGEG